MDQPTQRVRGLFAATALLAGCQTTPPPEALRTFTLVNEPHRAAVCIARNLDRYRSPYSAQVVPGTAPAIAEVHVRGAHLVAVAKLFIAGDGSTASIWMTPEPLFDRDALASAMIAGC